MLPKSLFFLPAWQRNIRDPHDPDEFSRCLFYSPPRCGHNAVCINNDLIIWGGYNESVFGHAEYSRVYELWVYNMDNDYWFCVGTEGKYPTARSGAVSVLNFPYWYIISGYSCNGDKSDTHVLNLFTLRWDELITAGKMSERDKASGWFWRERIYIFGGYGPRPKEVVWKDDEDVFTIELSTNRGWNNQLIYLDMDEKRWKRPDVLGLKPLPRAAHTSTMVRNSIYIFGGRYKTERMNDLHCFDLVHDRWSGSIKCYGELPCGRSWHSMSKILDSHLLLFGGYSSDNQPLEDAWLLNLDSYSWQPLVRKTGFPRLWHTACVNCHGDVLAYGGASSDIADSRVPLEASSKVIFFKTQPFSLQRLCLHVLYKNKVQTGDLWDSLPYDFREWLHYRCQFRLILSPDYYEHCVELGFGPSLSALSIVTPESAKRLNAARNGSSVDSL